MYIILSVVLCECECLCVCKYALECARSSACIMFTYPFNCLFMYSNSNKFIRQLRTKTMYKVLHLC